MILIITFKQDYTADFIINQLNAKNITYKRLNCEDILKADYRFEFIDSIKYKLLGEEKYDAVWFRRTRLPDLQDMPIAERSFMLAELDAFIQNLLCIIEAKWVSNPFYVYRAENKFLQLREATKLGFAIPDTLITSSKEELRGFYSKHEGKIIAKPIAHSRINYIDEPQFIFTNPVTAEVIDNLAEYDLTPCIFQRNISKDYEIRVTVVGDKVFPAAVYSQNDIETLTDWRRKKLDFHPVLIPEIVKQKCINLVNELH